MSQLPAMMHIARELCGGQICVTPDAATFTIPRPNRGWTSSTRSTRMGRPRTAASCSPSPAISLNCDYAGHRLTFQLFAQSPPFANLAAVYRTFDWSESLRVAQGGAGLSEHLLPKQA